ncbi:MAG: phage head closure protein [Candidatus Saccharimonadales bacterium]
MVEVQRLTTVDTGYGGTVQEYVPHVTLNGFIDMLSGNEVIAADKLGRKSSHILISFEIGDVRQEDRVIHYNEQYRVAYVDNPMGMNRQMEISLEWEKTL